MNLELDAVVRSLAEPFAFCAVGVSHRGARRFHIAGREDATPDTFWRGASISKVVTGRTAHAAFLKAGIDPANTTATDLLGLPICGPAGDAPTLAQIASHQSGLWDKAGYIVPTDVVLGDWITAQGGAIWSGAAAGQRFEYCNLGYILLAACAEQATEQRFDDLAQELILGPMGLQAGFNWVGLPETLPVLPTFRRDGTMLVPQIDAPRQDADAGTPVQH
ncbi:MAG: beta-lactamase family protein, partial [Octadecabacter sp.]|nr:beta-lactamase family protein [Octadecabacter sp.]